MFIFFFFNDTATTEIYTLSLHDALPISNAYPDRAASSASRRATAPLRMNSSDSCTSRSRRSTRCRSPTSSSSRRSEEHTSELQSQSNLVCRLLLEKKKHYHRYSQRRRLV